MILTASLLSDNQIRASNLFFFATYRIYECRSEGLTRKLRPEIIPSFFNLTEFSSSHRASALLNNKTLTIAEPFIIMPVM